MQNIEYPNMLKTYNQYPVDLMACGDVLIEPFPLKVVITNKFGVLEVSNQGLNLPVPNQ